MKIAFISDLHVDTSAQNQKLIEYLLEKLHLHTPDVFIIAGDIASSFQVFEKTLHLFSPLPCKKLLVAGNHDIWIDSPSSLQKGIHSGVKYYELIPRACEHTGFTFLGLNPQIVDGIGFAGTIGWYDYSLRNKDYDNLFSLETYRSKKYRNILTWNDRTFAHWREGSHSPRLSDEEVAQKTENALRKQLTSLAQRGIEKTVVVTHHVPFREMVFYPHRLPFDFFSAYMGSEGLGRIILGEKRVRYLICGHSHLKSSLTLEHFQARKSPVGYSREWKTSMVREVAEDRLCYFDI